MILIKEVPFDALKEVGISEKQFSSFPRPILDKLLTGRLSPLLALTFKNEKILAKLSIVKTNDSIEIKLFPVREKLETNFSLTKNERSKLENGCVIKKSILLNNKNEQHLLQLDRETKTIITSLVSNVYIPHKIGKSSLTKEDKDKLKNGEQIEITIGKNKETVGVDLNERYGLKLLPGDIRNWELQKKIEWDIANPCVKGFWQTSENSWEYKNINELKNIKTNSYGRI